MAVAFTQPLPTNNLMVGEHPVPDEVHVVEGHVLHELMEREVTRPVGHAAPHKLGEDRHLLLDRQPLQVLFSVRRTGVEILIEAWKIELRITVNLIAVFAFGNFGV